MPPKLVRICRMWRTFNHKNKDHCLGASFICIDIKVYGIYITISKQRKF